MGLTIFFHKEMVIQVYVPIVHNIVYCLCEFSKDQICAKISAQSGGLFAMKHCYVAIFE